MENNEKDRPYMPRKEFNKMLKSMVEREDGRTLKQRAIDLLGACMHDEFYTGAMLCINSDAPGRDTIVIPRINFAHWQKKINQEYNSNLISRANKSERIQCFVVQDINGKNYCREEDLPKLEVNN